MRSPGVSVWWRLRHSWWVLLPILGFSCLGGLGFLYVGIRARRPAWWISGIGYLLAGWGGFIGVGATDKESAASDWSIGVWFAAWVACVVHALVANVSWLQWRAGHRPWYAQPAPGWPGSAYPPGMLAPPPGPPVDGGFGGSVSGPPVVGQQGGYWAAGAAATPVSPGPVPPGPAPAAPLPMVDPAAAPLGFGTPVFGPPTSHPVAVGAPAAAPSPVDVNAAGAEQLAALTGFDAARTGRVLAAREARRGFGSVAEFAAAAELAPHEYARLRDLLICVPPAGPPAHPGTPSGRVLDF
ncbi:helix-hairpin-helix domain-containing protein [Micromonospora sp. NBC_01655]|uniref:helix-hairpin-helix domain-containing protein n=1 Tax=Micromonospora sp. NBC_01655 TaxID=2975983 RepID=UPI002259118A|nr:helix-hairpin-helix domain-containing protein [Micromonospora sp. NBC_01655]MCX4474140.1 helix-hairpin-helix domain-containing protein [Micromonospora sp. NBC_01655]